MFTLTLIILLLPFFTIALLPVIVKSFFTSTDLDEMGICLEKSETMSSYSFQEPDRILPKMTVPCVNV